ncbi:MAG TPA: alpha/beta hydrolase [Opitutaceae bacterium]|nr:alpha/beta hydrolase [Opitutaceae bacterium]HND60734.1 alpha/beta hydrolase [Opitutaceae bacterium]
MVRNQRLRWGLSRWLVTLAVAGYLALTAYAWLAADGMLYYPNYGSRQAPLGGEMIRLADGSELSALYLPNPAARYTIWYFHGNAEDLGGIAPRLHALHDLGFAVFAYDYPGYGLSSGHPSEARIYAASAAAWTTLTERYRVPPERIIVFGRSLGGGPAVDLAVRHPVAGLILQSTFMSVYRVMTRWRLLPFDQFENLRKIGRVRCPVLVMHGRMDEVIPFYHGEAIYAAAPAPKRSYWVDGAGHNDLEQAAGERYARELTEFAAGLTTAGPRKTDFP